MVKRSFFYIHSVLLKQLPILSSAKNVLFIIQFKGIISRGQNNVSVRA